jgi:type II secretory pathway component PulJ
MRTSRPGRAGRAAKESGAVLLDALIALALLAIGLFTAFSVFSASGNLALSTAERAYEALGELERADAKFAAFSGEGRLP